MKIDGLYVVTSEGLWPDSRALEHLARFRAANPHGFSVGEFWNFLREHHGFLVIRLKGNQGTVLEGIDPDSLSTGARFADQVLITGAKQRLDGTWE